MVDNTFERLDRLFRERPAVHDVLQCSPFDASRNLDGRATPEIFFEHLFVESPTFQKLKNDLYNQLTDPARNHRVIFIEGFSGSGKTTFIKYFIDRYRDTFEGIYIDFFPLAQRKLDESRVQSSSLLERARRDLEDTLATRQGVDAENIKKAIKELQSVTPAARGDQEWERSHPIEFVLKSHLLAQNEGFIKDFLYFLHEKAGPLSNFFPGGFGSKLKSFEPAVEINRLQEFLISADLTDTFLIFFLYYARRYEKQRTLRHLIVFDNLDTVKLAYLTRFFKETFVNAFGVFARISQNRAIFREIIEFNSKFKFLFCLRDANNTTINAHMADQLDYLSSTFYFRIGFDADLYQRVMRRRLEFLLFLQQTGPLNPESQRVKKIIEMLIAFSSDPFFTEILAPLLNFNFRKLTHLLFEATNDLVKTPAFRGGLSFENISPDNYTEVSFDRYGANGAILFGMTQKLREGNFLEKYPFFPVTPDPDEGYCLSTRMVLSVLLNKSDLERSQYVLDRSKPFRDVPLSEIIKSVGKVYDIGEVVGALVEVFLLHTESWVHLVTFRDKPVEDKHAFDAELNEIANTGEVPDRLNRVLVTMNPSGFVFLKTLITHFEFYSVLSKNRHALFALGLTKNTSHTARYLYLFEDCIHSVQRMVLNHLTAMKKFYEAKFIKNGWTDQRYLKSEFVFKHFKSGAPAPRGYFHSTRVIMIHIRYVDEFRVWLLKRNESKIDHAELVDVNRRLVAAIDGYLNMLIKWSPGERQLKYEAEVTEKIEQIKASEYYDMKTRIAPPKT
jgi:hypothetical protein